MKKIRRLGDILLDMEPYIQEAMDDHDLQWGDMLGLMFAYLHAHYPNHKEVYCKDGKSPVFFYGPEENLNVKSRKRTLRPNNNRSKRDLGKNRMVHSHPSNERNRPFGRRNKRSAG